MCLFKYGTLVRARYFRGGGRRAAPMRRALAHRGRAPRRGDRVVATLASFDGELLASAVGAREVARLGLPQEPGEMYLRLQRPRRWGEAQRARAARRRAGADVDTFWEDGADWTDDPPPVLVPEEGELLRLRGEERHATTRVRHVELLSEHTVIVRCLEVTGMHIPRAVPP
jgi:hypothetical protein